MNWQRKKGSSYLIACVVIVLLVGLLPACAAPTPPKTIKIGVIGPMEAVMGKHQWASAEIGAEEINQGGGVEMAGEKYQIELVKKDSKELRSIDDAIRAMEELITIDKVDIVLGGFRSEAVSALQDVAADYKQIWIIGPTGSSTVATRIKEDYERYKYQFRIATPPPQGMPVLFLSELNLAANEIRDKLGITTPRVAGLIEKAAWADPFAPLFEKMCPAMGLEYVGTWRPSPLATDVSAELTAIKAAKTHIVYCITAGELSIPISRTWGETKHPTALIGKSLAPSDLHWEATHGMCNYETSMAYYAPDVVITEETMPFWKKFKEKTGQSPLFTACEYDAMYVAKEAIERAGTLEADALVKALEATDFNGAAGRIAFTPKDHPTRVHDLRFGPGYVTNISVQWQDGKLVCVWPDGRPLHPAIAAMGEKMGVETRGWEGLKYAGSGDYKLPPWMIEYWKTQK